MFDLQAHALDNEIKARKMFDQNMIISLTERECKAYCLCIGSYISSSLGRYPSSSLEIFSIISSNFE